MRPMPLRRIRRNADPGLRELERAASSGAVDDLIAYARGRRRVGEDVADWELHPVGYVFLEAWGDLEDAIGLRTAERAKMVRYAGMQPPKMTTGRVEAFPVGRERPEKFYVTVCSYPLNRPGVVPPDWAQGATMPRRESEEILHRAAVAEWRERGAVVVRLEFDAQAEHLADGDHGQGRHYNEAGVCEYCRWLDAYRWRVLIQSDDIRNAAGAPGWCSGWRYQPVLIPHDFMRARVMKKKGKRWKNNPDLGMRELERRAAAGDERAEAQLLQARVRASEANQRDVSRLRQLRGERVDPWEFGENTAKIGQIFLEACESWDWGWIRAGREGLSQNPNRVEGRRLCFRRGSRPTRVSSTALRRDLYFPVSMEYDPEGGPQGEALLLAQPIHRKAEWAPGDRPLEQFGTLLPLEQFGTLLPPELYPCQGAPRERFYVVPSGYPMSRTGVERDPRTREPSLQYEATARREREIVQHESRLDREEHLRAVEWFVSHGAVRYNMPGDPTRKRTGTPAHESARDRWWDAYRQRVLLQVVNKQGAPGFHGGYGAGAHGDNNPRILFPWMWSKARLMKRVGKRWKNNPW